MRIIPFLVTGAWLAMAAPDAAAQEFAAVRAAAIAETVPKLESLADWAQKSKLFRDSVRTWDLILKLHPEHSKARGILRYSRQLDGSWKQSADFKEPVNTSADHATEFQIKRAGIVDPFCEKIFHALDAHGAGTDTKLREATLKMLLAIDPKNPKYRSAWLATRRGGLIEAADGPLFVAQLKDLEASGKALLDSIPDPKETRKRTVEEKLGIPWMAAVETDHVRILGSMDPAETRDAARKSEAVGILFQRMFSTPPLWPTDFTIYLLGGGGERESFLKNFPGIPPEQRQLAESTEGVWASDSQVVDWSKTRDRRVDGAVRQTLGKLMANSFRIGTKPGWVPEGFGIYLSYQITRTRLTWLVPPSRYANQAGKLRDRLVQPDADWFREARKLWDSPTHPRLPNMMAVDIGSMTDEDLLASYALAACLLSLRAAETPALLRAIGEGLHPQEALQSTLGLGLDELDALFHSWLKSVAP